MIYITGDTHGEHARFFGADQNLSRSTVDYQPFDSVLKAGDILIVCGDFGYLIYNSIEEEMFFNEIATRPYTVCFVDGNHENFPALNRFPVEEWNGGKIHRIRNNIFHLMRGQIFTIDGKTFFTFGGAYSIDRPYRVLNYSYWEEEMPCKEDYDEALRNLNAHNLTVDYVLTHTAPGMLIPIMGFHSDQHSIEMDNFLDYIYMDVHFRHWYCGHWHIDKQVTDRFTVLWYDRVCLDD